MPRLIEVDFPIRELNDMVPKERSDKTPPIYRMHKWWAHRAGCIFRALILATFLPEGSRLFDPLGGEFYKKHKLNKVVLDPFMGVGTTIVEALRLGCKGIGMDIHPVAWFATKKEIEPVDLAVLGRAFEDIEAKVADKIKSYYETRCLQGHQAEVIYVFWVNKVQCQRGGEEVKLFPSYILAKKTNKQGEMLCVFCPECYSVWWTPSGEKELSCPTCLHSFDPNQGIVTRGKFRCEHGSDAVLDVVRKMGHPPEAEMFAIEYYCPVCKKSDYKPASEEDHALFLKAKADWLRLRDEVMGKLVPSQTVQDGVKTRGLLNYQYRYFHQMFNERQLLCLSLLFREILALEEASAREVLLLAFSDSLKVLNKFATPYPKGYTPIRESFSYHAYIPPSQWLEANPWIGGLAFCSCVRHIKEAFEYRRHPWNGNLNSKPARRLIGDGFEARLALSYPELVSGNRDALLLCQTAEDLSFLPNASVDAVITDPPYCDNVMYGELADFFHVWQRLALKDTYPWFRPLYTPKKSEGELVVIPGGSKENQKRERAEFWEGLTRCFRECRRVLRDDGLLVFTFHHSKPWAWSGLMKSILDAGFAVAAVYPLDSEQKTSIHRGGADYDIPCVCRKKEGDKPMGSATLATIKDEVYGEVVRLLRLYREQGKGLKDEDVFVILMGKCLQVFSRYYPQVYDGQGKPLRGEEGIRQALEEMAEMVEGIIKEEDLRFLPVVDDITRDYCLYIAGRYDLSTDDLRKRFHTGGEMTDFIQKMEGRQLIEHQGQKVTALAPPERRKYLEDQIEKGKALTLIDHIHRLYIACQGQRSPFGYFPEIDGIADLPRVAHLLFLKTGVKVYDTIRETAEAWLREHR